jgi:DNA-binding transcriptional LysR family regulator
MGIDQLTLALKNFELDVAFTDLDQLRDKRLETLPLYEEPLHLLLPNNDWLDDASEVDWAAAADLPLCLLSPPSREREIMNDAFASVKCTPSPQLESNSIFQLAFHVMAGDLATIVPKRFTELPGTRDKLLVNPTVTQKVGLVWVSGNPILPMARATIEILTQAVEQGVFENSK